MRQATSAASSDRYAMNTWCYYEHVLRYAPEEHSLGGKGIEKSVYFVRTSAVLLFCANFKTSSVAFFFLLGRARCACVLLHCVPGDCPNVTSLRPVQKVLPTFPPRLLNRPLQRLLCLLRLGLDSSSAPPFSYRPAQGPPSFLYVVVPLLRGGVKCGVGPAETFSRC